ncbi:MAG: nucleotidyltransferase domain-containing protein [Bdellovibrionota bacterium]
MIQHVLKSADKFQIFRKIILFGSQAKGTAHKKSDYDFAFELLSTDSESLLMWGQLTSILNEKKPKLNSLDLIRMDQISDEFKNNILKDGIVLYSSSND